uniref:Uncharacterized protein n=1 Tax=Ganoderma boninense TaxID=34458 RepID=A0A5K1K7B3_9APHY|nr:Uncharacterized protein [Ganoderma boninense]
MESDPSFSSSSESLFVLLPIVQESLKFLVLGTVLSSFLIPTAVMFFFFSTPRLRRQPIFIFNVIAIIFGLVQGVINFVNSTRPMLNEPEIPIANSTVAISLFVLVPLCVESVLILKVVAVYPPRLLSGTRCLALYLPIALLKAARVTNAAYFIYLLLQGPHAQNALSLAEFVWHMPNGKVEWLMQLIDDSTLFWISASNFVFPVLLNVAQLVLILRDGDFERGVLVLIVNNYVTIIGVLLATIWASGSRASECARRSRMMPGARRSRSPRASLAARRLVGEKDGDGLSPGSGNANLKRRPSSAPPGEKAVVVRVEECEEVPPSSMV